MGNNQVHEAREALKREYGVELADMVDKLATVCGQVHDKISIHHDRSCLPGTYVQQPNRPFFVNLALMFEGLRKRETPVTSNRSFRNVEDMNFAKEMVRHAIAAYLGYKHDIALLLDNIAEHDIKHTYSPVLSRCPRFYIAHDPNRRAVIVSIRGESSAMEAMEHCIAPKVAYCGGYANEDLLERSQLLLDAVGPTIRQLFAADTYPGGLVFTGHGPGGGVAILAALALLALDSPVAKGFGVNHSDVWSVAFGAPPVFAPASIIPQRINEHIISVVNDMDIIPRLCLGTVAELLLAIRRVDELPLSLYEHKLEGMDINEAVANLPRDLDKDFGSLHHVGTIIGIFKQDEKWKVHRLESENLDQILLHRQMMKDHAIEAYEDALRESYDFNFHPKVQEVVVTPSVCC